jgi:hypothetical protein
VCPDRANRGGLAGDNESGDAGGRESGALRPGISEFPPAHVMPCRLCPDLGSAKSLANQGKSGLENF